MFLYTYYTTGKQNVNKQTALVAAAVMVFGVSSAWAADSTSTQINISATVPSTAFYAQASSPTFGQAEVMGYDIGQNKINSLRENFTYKSTGGALRVYRCRATGAVQR